MKKLILAMTFTFLCLSLAFAQIEEALKPMSVGVENSFNVVIPDVDEKDVEKLWKDYLKPYKGKTKKLRKENELFTDDATIPDLSPNTIDVYAKMTEVNDEVLFSVWFDLGGGFLSSETHPDKVSAAQKIVLLFALEVSKKSTEDELKEEEKELKKAEKELTKLERQNAKLHSDIEAYKQKILEAEAAIKKNEAEQVSAKTQIENQKVKVQTVKSKLEGLKN